MFLCSMCGECCRNLDKSEFYKELDRGDGTCWFLEGNLCRIYKNRPLLCRIDEAYQIYFQELYTKEEYDNLNHLICEKLGKHQL